MIQKGLNKRSLISLIGQYCISVDTFPKWRLAPAGLSDSMLIASWRQYQYRSQSNHRSDVVNTLNHHCRRTRSRTQCLRSFICSKDVVPDDNVSSWGHHAKVLGRCPSTTCDKLKLQVRNSPGSNIVGSPYTNRPVFKVTNSVHSINIRKRL